MRITWKDLKSGASLKSHNWWKDDGFCLTFYGKAFMLSQNVRNLQPPHWRCHTKSLITQFCVISGLWSYTTWIIVGVEGKELRIYRINFVRIKDSLKWDWSTGLENFGCFTEWQDEWPKQLGVYCMPLNRWWWIQLHYRAKLNQVNVVNGCENK